MAMTSLPAQSIHSPTMIVPMLLTLLVAATATQQTRAAGFCDLFKPGERWSAPSHRPGWYPMYPAVPPWATPAQDLAADTSVIGVLRRAGGFGTLLAAIEAAGLTGLLEGRGPYTLFAPTDAAFSALPDDELQSLLADRERLQHLIKLHVVPRLVGSAQVLTSRSLETAAGESVATSSLRVSRADIPAANGVIHVVDAVLVPAE